MNKNSIKEVAKTYQRLVEAASAEAITSPSIEPNLETSPKPKPINLDPNDFSETLNQTANNYMNELLRRLNACYSNPGSCKQEDIDNMTQEYYRWLLRNYGPYGQQDTRTLK